VINLVDYYKISRDRLDIPALYTGPVTKLLGGADISWLVGIVVTPAIYYPWAKATSRAPAESIYPAAPTEDRIPLAAAGKAQKPDALSLLVPKTAV
jgi:nucleobase:cation symporter-1, NCS1 family